MNPAELLRLVDTISRDRGLGKEQIIADIEAALIQAARKRHEAMETDFSLTIDRETGEITAYEDNSPVDIESLGRIVANVAKQMIIQKLREDERDLLYDEYEDKVGTVIQGVISRRERGTVIVNIGKTEAILPKDEQIYGEAYRPGMSIRAYLLRANKNGQRIKLILSRTHVNLVRELFEQEVPEIADGSIEIKGLVREPGNRIKIAVAALDPRLDAVGTCVGMRGSRINKISNELGGERIDIIPWVDDDAQFIINSLKPAAILHCSYDPFRDRAVVAVSQDQLPLAIGKAGQNVRLSARLTHYRIDVLSESQVSEKRIESSSELQKLIEAELIEDFVREILLDNHLDTLSIIAAQTTDTIMDNIEEYQEEVENIQKIIDKANELLTEEQQEERDNYISIRERIEAEELAAIEEEAAAAEEEVIESEGDTEKLPDPSPEE